MKLDDLRRQIDRIDRDIVRLLNRRTKVAMRIGRLKKEAGVPVFIARREKNVLERIARTNAGPLPDSSLRHIYREIISAARALEGGMAVACAPSSAAAARAKFGDSVGYVRCATLAAAQKAVKSGRASLAVLPANSKTSCAVVDQVECGGAEFVVVANGAPK